MKEYEFTVTLQMNGYVITLGGFQLRKALFQTPVFAQPL